MRRQGTRISLMQKIQRYLGWCCMPLTSLRHERDLVDVVEVDAAGKQEDHQQDSGHPLVMLGKASVMGRTYSLGKAASARPGLTPSQ